MSGTRAGPRRPFSRLAANRLHRVSSPAMAPTFSAGRADTEVPASPGAERPFRDVGKLTPRQARFVDEYLIDLNATQAAIRAGYSAKNADKIGPELLGNTRVSAAIAEAQAKRSERITVSQDDVVKGLHAEATDKTNGSSSSRVAAWGLLGKHLNMFIDRRLVGAMNVHDMNEAQLLAFLGLDGLPEEEIARKLTELTLELFDAAAAGDGGGRAGAH